MFKENKAPSGAHFRRMQCAVCNVETTHSETHTWLLEPEVRGKGPDPVMKVTCPQSTHADSSMLRGSPRITDTVRSIMLIITPWDPALHQWEYVSQCTKEVLACSCLLFHYLCQHKNLPRCLSTNERAKKMWSVYRQYVVLHNHKRRSCHLQQN